MSICSGSTGSSLTAAASPGGDFDRDGPATGAGSVGGVVDFEGAVGGAGIGVPDGVRVNTGSGVGAATSGEGAVAAPPLLSRYD